MNKSQLLENMAKETGMSMTESKKVLDAMLKVGAKTLKKGERITISNVASFFVKTRAPRTGRNPQTGKPLVIKAKKVVGFKANCPPPH